MSAFHSDHRAVGCHTEGAPVEVIRRATDERGPVFIVGASRSGTELMRSILNAGSRVCISQETHYFDDLRSRLAGGGVQLSGREWGVALAYFQAIEAAAYGVHEPEAFFARPDLMLKDLAMRLGGTGDALFQAFCERNAVRSGREIWGEKTPRHLFNVEEILRAYPKARFLVMQRDPRAVVASYRDWRNRWFQPDSVTDAQRQSIAGEEKRTRQSYSLTVAALMWVSAARTARALEAKLGGEVVRVVRFEDLLEDPEATMRGVTDWLELVFEPGMLRVEVLNSSYLGRGGRHGLDRSVAERWRGALSPDEMAYVDWLAGSAAREAGYDPSGARLHPAFALHELLTLPLAVCRAILANRRRIGHLGSFVVRRLKPLFRIRPRAAAANRESAF